MSFEDGILQPEEFLQLIGGSLCPCGHPTDKHDPPSGQIEGEKSGDCNVEGCSCRGVIDISDDF